ncbi:MAG TPA: MASE1 domain-containing protein [Tepidisphaeraceae bacterium]|jgi:two-component system sensor histidine kinase UhpB
MREKTGTTSGRDGVPFFSPTVGNGADQAATLPHRILALLRGSHAARATLTGLMYYVGGQIDAFMGTPSSPAALWPPNAILLTALLFAPPGIWWMYLLAAALADRAISWPLAAWWAGGLYVSNTLQTVLAVTLLRLTWRGSPNWRQFRFLIHFLLSAVVLAPLVGAFLGAATVHGFRPDVPFWAAWRGWFIANALTNLILVPTVAIAAMSMNAEGKRPHWHPDRGAEAALVFLGLLAGSVGVFELFHPHSDVIAALLYVPLPFMLWTAVRFGPGLSSAAQLLVVLVALHGTTHGRGPFAGLSHAANVLQLQLFLLAICLPIMFLAAALWERGQAIAALIASERQAHRAREKLEQSNHEVQELAGRLIAAQEEERSRIARELHDDLSQRLATISLGLSALKRHTQGNGQKDLSRLQGVTVELAAEFRSLSHELHPGILQHAGLTAALRARCRELDGHNGMSVTFAGDDDLAVADVPPAVASCLYRIAQEALRNVSRHAGARRAAVVLRSDPRALRLTVCDDGRGFDLAACRSSAGVGLVSMEERVRLVHGTVEIDTHPGRGTELRVSVPLATVAGRNGGSR